MVNQTHDGSNLRFGLRVEAHSKLYLDRFSFLCIAFCAISVFGQVALILVSFQKLPPQLPIFYSKPWGEPMLAGPIAIWILPGLTLFFVAINYVIARFVLAELFLYRVLLTFSAICAFAALYDMTKIISLLV